MPILRSAIEWTMIRRMGRLLTFWNLDGTTADGTNPDIGAAMAKALMAVGAAPADITEPTDADMATVKPEKVNELLDLVHLALLEACLDNADEVRQREGVNEQEWNGRIAELRRRIDQKRGEMETLYGYGLGLLEGGTVTVSFLAKPNERLEEGRRF